MGYKRWQKLHRTVYFCGIASVTHYYLIVKSDIRLPLLYGAILTVLLGYRVIKTPAQPQTSPGSRGGSGRLDPARHAQARTQLARKAPVLSTYIIRLNVAALVTFRPRAPTVTASMFAAN